MSKLDSPYIIGDHWLEKRKDGRSPNWQVAWLENRQIQYRSTRSDDLEKAKSYIEAFVSTKNSISGEGEEAPLAFVMLKLYWVEHGSKVVSPAQIKSSIRAFVGFLAQDKVGHDATVEDLRPEVFERFIQWRKFPHSWKVMFDGKEVASSSKGVKGESIKRNLDDLTAAFNHNVRRGRMSSIFVPSIPASERSAPRDRVLSPEELGAIVGYAQNSPQLYQWIMLMLGTAARPEAAMAFDPELQVRGEVINLHPPAWAKTKKVNPSIPLIPPLRAITDNWRHFECKSHKTAWRTMRRVLNLSDDVHAKTIRHTVATMLLDDGDLHPHLIESLLGHRVLNKTTAVYAKWNVRHMSPLIEPLTAIWNMVDSEASAWRARHLLDTTNKGRVILRSIS